MDKIEKKIEKTSSNNQETTDRGRSAEQVSSMNFDSFMKFSASSPNYSTGEQRTSARREQAVDPLYTALESSLHLLKDKKKPKKTQQTGNGITPEEFYRQPLKNEPKKHADHPFYAQPTDRKPESPGLRKTRELFYATPPPKRVTIKEHN